jgi:hypothetical protein
MCHGLAGLHASVVAYAGGFDAGLLPPEELEGALAYASGIEKSAAALTSAIAARMAEGAGGPGRGGERSAAEKFARAAGTSQAKARRQVEAARRLSSQPEVEQAARAGKLSRDQAEVISGAAEVNPGATTRLLDLAQRGSMAELVEEANRARAAAEDLEARRRRVREARYLRQWAAPDGTWHIAGQGLPEQGAAIWAGLQPFIDEAFKQAREEGRRERPEAYAFDALVRLATSGRGRATGYEVVVRVDQAALLRGYALEGEACEVAGFGTLTPQAVYDIMATGDPFLKAVVTKGKDIIGVAHLGRRPNAYQKTALDWLFPTCAAEGCGVRAAFLQTDHRLDWKDCHVTVFDLLDRLCRRHHRMKTEQGWALVAGRGKRPFVPPGDPRHPKGSAGGAATGPPRPANGHAKGP